MELQVESTLMGTRPSQPIGKSQLYTLLVDAAGNPVLDASGNRQVVAVQSTNGRLQVDSSSTGNAQTKATLQNGALAIGNGTSMDVSNMGTVVFDVQGTFVGTIIFEGSTDDQVWGPIQATLMGGGPINNSAIAAGQYRSVVTGLKSVRARVSAYTSGSITVKATASVGDAPSKVVNVAGSPMNIKAAPLIGVKTVTSVAAELFAGASRLVTRGFMKVYVSGAGTVYYGPAGVTTSTGWPILSGDTEPFFFSTDVPIYFVASANTTVIVEER